ncbi:hypothetical protein [Lacipirellula parvula]|uniref:Uncharacterized protein n=1 Tax=Lacipirellula parvula TaxID=2650471 RepID=A0A5K7X241_9BACT|nr:hypothetical protein [Lacipirellula parvula]BBO30724.1 hypothetical protein PLANPX_0336 [Lacipirellula parvula]
MSPRLKLQSVAKPLLLAGALWSAGLATPAGAVGHGGNRPQTPPPCGPDGVCVPNIPTYGWYQTRWRTFPGDAKGVTPDQVKKQEEKDEQAESMTGPRTPTPAEEGTITRERPKRAGQPAAEGGPVPDPNEDIRNLPGLPPLPGPGDAAPAPAGPAGPAGEAAPAPAGGLPLGPAGQPAPAGTEPDSGGSNPLDPFGSAPPAPPWLSQSMTNPAAGELVQLPYVQQAGGQAGGQVVQPVDNIEPVLDGPNLRGDDAPPALPPALQRLSGIRSPAGQGAVVVAPALPPALAPTRTAMAQPSSVQAKPAAGPASLQPSRYIQQASAVVPVGGQMVSPMGTMDAATAGQGAQQAIYIEAGVVK